MHDVVREEVETAFTEGLSHYEANPEALADDIAELSMGPDTVEKATATHLLSSLKQHQDAIVEEATTQIVEQVDLPTATQTDTQQAVVADGSGFVIQELTAKIYLTAGGFMAIASMLEFRQEDGLSALLFALATICCFIAFFAERELAIRAVRE